MKEELHAGYTLAPDAMELIQNIHFEGNIRWLRNLAERLNYSDQQYIDAGELKRYLDQDVYGDEGANRQETELLEQFLSENSGRLERILPSCLLLSRRNTAA